MSAGINTVISKTLNIFTIANDFFSHRRGKSMPKKITATYTLLMPLADIQAQAEQGNAEQQYVLANLYCNGEGVAQDYRQAAKLFYHAALQDHRGAQSKLGLCFEYGYGIGKDEEEALRWYARAQQTGHTTPDSGITGETKSRIIPLAIAILIGYALAKFL